MPAAQPSGFAATLLSSPQAGEEVWWQQVARLGTPLVEMLDAGQVRVTFLWRDPNGDERHSAIQRVYADINGVTDHHSTDPQSLKRLPATDVWHWSMVIEHDWRGSYSLIPVVTAQLPPVFSDDESLRDEQQREWWCSLFPSAIADPLSLCLPWGAQLSAAHMPAAPSQQAWRAVDNGSALPPDAARLTVFDWQSEQLDNQRRIWLYATGSSDEPAQRPLCLVLDGQRWAEDTPLFSALEAETLAGHLPSAVWLFIDAIDGETRCRELPCDAVFWQAVQQELLPLAARLTPFSDDPDRTVVAGQSYGGLAALYAGLHWPQRFGRVLTQSGSFWWPNLQFITDFELHDTLEPGVLVTELRQGGRTASPLVIFQEAGRREADIAFVNQQMHEALIAAGHQVHQRVYAGGHDTLCWRGGLIDGFRWLLSDAGSQATSQN
ncbi:enterochelin esterase [Dickeya dianthicola]|uniref:Enterochelin esterase n=1 Tax=Dickeya dianthicola TaxID=204039 RepID=A0ABX9NLF5_9GAMM|nr:enterochelin esterase [Dickeya dianthicola]MCI4117101.1 enterochelin esterase [Dickeya dianthicola]MCI4120080.1 enterochelin esterase [Dickeya dianthicola]MCI4123674.1 enterochelin esterase [Dickeya dianthicola]RJL70058.1 enterochelin esterase [Dickeya dianthicola]RJL73488.1 enterochelin esterase [Dickeya dianthicola]